MSIKLRLILFVFAGITSYVAAAFIYVATSRYGFYSIWGILSAGHMFSVVFVMTCVSAILPSAEIGQLLMDGGKIGDTRTIGVLLYYSIIGALGFFFSDGDEFRKMYIPVTVGIGCTYVCAGSHAIINAIHFYKFNQKYKGLKAYYPDE